jgi:hypothetical protein
VQELAPPSRVCAVCHGQKPISGVWYLLPSPRTARAADFVCESCFRPILAERAA